MFYIYILRSKSHPNQTYIGSTSDLRRRLAEHNAGKSTHTNKFKPWNLAAYVALNENQTRNNSKNTLRAVLGGHSLVDIS